VVVVVGATVVVVVVATRRQTSNVIDLNYLVAKLRKTLLPLVPEVNYVPTMQQKQTTAIIPTENITTPPEPHSFTTNTATRPSRPSRISRLHAMARRLRVCVDLSVKTSPYDVFNVNVNNVTSGLM
jgi:hypothetical protein